MNDLMISIMIEINLLLRYLQIDDILKLKLYHTFTEDIYEYILESKMNNVMISIMIEIVNSLLIYTIKYIRVSVDDI